MHLPRAYWREIVVVLVLKAAALTLLYVLFFASAPRDVPAGDHIFLHPSEHPSEKGRSG